MPGVDPVKSAARELKEETGLTARHWQKLLEADLSNSVSDEKAITFIAWGLTQGVSMPEPTEDITVRRIALEEAFRMVAAGEVAMAARDVGDGRRHIVADHLSARGRLRSMDSAAAASVEQ